MPRWVKLAALCAAGVVFISACVRSRQATARNATLRIAAAAPKVASQDLGLNALVNGLAKDALVAYAPDGRTQVSLADSWKWDESKTRLRLWLRRGVVFHNGEPLTADLAVKSLRDSLRRERVVSFAGITSISAVDPSTLDIQLEHPDSFLLPDLASVFIQYPSDSKNGSKIGTGPFRIGNSSAAGATLYAFDKYYRGRPAMDEIDIQAYQTQRKAWAAMLRGDADVLHDVSRDAVDFVEAETRISTYTFPRAYYIALAFNVRNPALKDPAVRRAINRAIDRNQIVADGLRGRGKAADGPVWPDHWAYVKPRHPFEYEPDAARAELDAADFPVRQDPAGGMPKRFSFTCLVYAEDQRFDRTALLLQKELYEIGIDMRLEPVSLEAMQQRGATGDFDALLFEMLSGKDLGWVYAFWHSPAGRKLIDTGYRSADGALDDMRRATSDEDVRRATGAFNDVISADPPAAFLAWQAQARAASKRIVIPPESNRDILQTVRLWRFAGTEEPKQ